ncbi:MAG: glycosyltransferase [Acidobacteriota bacterium]
MRVVLFYHSLVSDWNHGNAHFLRGVAAELLARGHDVRIFEPEDGWSRANLLAEHGEAPLSDFRAAFPNLASTPYAFWSLDLDEALDGANLVVVHEWNAPALVGRLGQHRARSSGYKLLFHDTHHRAVTNERALAAYDLSHYDGVLAYGAALRDLYVARGWAPRAWTWHEAADTRVFRPLQDPRTDGDLVWIGNWGDDERAAEIHEFLIQPVRGANLRAAVYGVRYPPQALAGLAGARIAYRGWLPNYRVPEVFARFRATIHIPRRPYTEALPGIPTIRVFEALACGIPLVSAPWDDAERLFTPGDFLIARDGAEMKRLLKHLLSDERMAHEMAARGRRTVLARHTCAHRVDELFQILEELNGSRAAATGVPA